MNEIKRYFQRVKKDINDDQSKSRRSADNLDRPMTQDELDESDDLAIDTYKVVTIANDKATPFLIYGDESLAETPLNSGSLIRLLDFRTADNSFLEKVLDLKGAEIGIADPGFSKDDRIRHSSMCSWFHDLDECSAILKESMIFYNFDPYCNFLLGEQTTMRDVKHIIDSTTSRDAMNPDHCLNYDFTRMVNPYGLERVVFTGGGTKGNIYIGTTIGLLACGQIFYLNHFRGSSIGGLSAMVASCITPPRHEYLIMSNMTLREIMTRGCWIVRRYQRAVEFATSRFCERNIDAFYEKPSFSLYGIWTMASKIMKNNGLYNPEESGFQVWYSLICLRICQIMQNGLADKIIIRDENGQKVRFIEEYSPSDHRYTDPAKRSSKQETKVSTANNTDEIEKNNDLVATEDKPTDSQSKGGFVLPGIFSSLSSEETYREIREADIDTLNFTRWTVEAFYTFDEYQKETGKTIMFTGTKTDPVETVYYCVEDPNYRHMTVLQGARATMSIPWVFEAPVIDGSYHLDGGLYDNFPLTTDDIKIKERIKHYNNKVFGYLIDDQNTIIDAYEVIRELWLVYTGFLQIMNVGYLSEASNFDEITQLFFEIRSEVYKMIYFADSEIMAFLDPVEVDRSNESYNINGLREVMGILEEHMYQSSYLNFKLVKRGVEYVERCLRDLQGADHRIRRRNSVASTSSASSIDSTDLKKFKIGRTTDISDIMDLTVKHGSIYNELIHLINSDLREIQRMETDSGKMKIVKRYERILNHLMQDILGYYEVKGTFIRTNDLDQPCRYFRRLLKDLNTKLVKFNEITNEATESLKKNKNKTENFRNYIQPSIDIGLTMISKIVTRGTGNGYDIKDIQSSQSGSSYQKVVDYFFHTDMTGILYKYMCIASDRIQNDSFNQMRTIKLNTFETNTLHFDMPRELKCRLIYEGYSKTIKFFVNQLRIMEMTKRKRSSETYVPSYELKYKRLYGK